MVQTAVQVFWNAMEGLLSLARPLGLLLGVGLLALLLLGLLDRERFRAGLGWLGARLPGLGRWALPALAVGAGMGGLGVVRQATDLRLATQQSARYANAADADGGQTVQAAPRASFLEETTYTRSFLLPRSVYTQINVDGEWERLLPYLGGGGPGPSVKDLSEGFIQQQNGLVYTREVTLLTDKPVNLDTSTVQTDLRFVDPAGGRGSYYNALFRADYAFTNPNPDARTMRFAFPLPNGSGTLSDFRLTVNGKEFRAADLVDGSIWEGEVAGRAAVKVNVTYRNQGARSWSYQLGGRREAIQKFDLTVRADRPAKFQRYSLFPTSRSGGGLAPGSLSGEQTLRWSLSDVITAQDVSVVFTGGSLRETLAKIGAVRPLAILAAALLALAWAWTRRLPLAPLPLAGGLLGLALGLALGGVLGFYLPVWAAETLGVIAGVALGVYALGTRFTAPLLLAAALPLVFLSGGHASLLLVLLATGTLVLLAARRVRVGAARAG
ncbi:hypothetical protein SAMN04488058_101362 [Deinococcus reticulitermitis]|uniref:Inner membrane protein n=1 Tax=Deinococcus reticulitermitis TaxID=856736 RepID=A0A1H6SX98_9DEIO|nr:hypothetical protein [Deinococcus reticulitermitis]SEI69397.1 hypothetical protein SAMN04488058_101362 [Deinococcus reticulitermitis]